MLAEEIRQQILSACMKNGGHLGASLGAVEIAIALHTVFESPREPIVWDVGHQAYAHKLLTGRWDRFQSIRTPGGLSGFLNRSESEHDAFGAGHSSTSLSAALAMAWTRAESPDWTVAVIGDGGLTAGLAFEALNNIRTTKTGPFLVVLNDNAMSISQNAGALPDPRAHFDVFGFDYVGPIDGHDLHLLIGTLAGIRASWTGRPVVLHVITQKGKGYQPAEEQPSTFHGIAPVRKSAGPENVDYGTSFSSEFGEAICRAAEADPRVVAITAAMAEGTGLQEFSIRFPDRFFDVGIAEAHAVTFAAGLASQGYRPVVAVYSTFLQRALDSIIHDVALQRLPVTFAVDRAGLVGADGPTHHGAFDLAYLSMIPGLRIFAPASGKDVYPVLSECLTHEGPAVLRYPRGSGTGDPGATLVEGLRCIRLPKRPCAIAVGIGPSASLVLRAADQLGSGAAQVAVFGLVQVKPIPSLLIEYLRANSGTPLLVVEQGSSKGGIGEHLLVTEGNGRRCKAIGYGDHFISHGRVPELEALEGISVESLALALEGMLA